MALRKLSKDNIDSDGSELRMQHNCRAGVLNFLSSTGTVVVVLFTSEHTHKIPARTSTVYEYFKAHYPI
jgi:hypothetical protein